MKSIFLKKAYLKDGWADNVQLDIDDAGIVHSINENVETSGHFIAGFALPGVNNIHSHAFQRAMAGLAEYSTSSEDSFWTWRDIMYRFAGIISDKDLRAIAAQLYMEMLKAGYVSVSEFHYLHGGRRNAVQMSNAILSAAHDVGIGLCHLPVLYMSSGFGDQPLNDRQRQFGLSVDEYLKLQNDLELLNDNQHIGTCFHSLRAVPEGAMKDVLENTECKGPIHIHIAEQMAEVNDSIEFSGKRPVEWLYDNVDVDDRWCLIHATHLNDDETRMIAASGAVAGLCPTTEANLGDGLFPLTEFLDRQGTMAIGSDSHVSISVSEELRLLEYGQRLSKQGRNIAVNEDEIHTGTNLYNQVLMGGAQASGFNNGVIEVGKRADLIVLDDNKSTMVGTPDKNIIDRFIFNGNQNVVKDVFVGGNHVINDYHHISEVRIFEKFKAVVERLKIHLD
ncbi:formimidoylglutamate deiminase [Pseudemcibacter aquimaris]|uniref:formimidoylglutamate deiminase n=1 Tax=Pseudemcibacter aquimaris TaxID=2857064 RepID=UPI0020131805|nr:formimidoylglutamate deiminase [Pseudemcibacter aquimaris]MCC3861992.1 formimidoylglutamate deiminase [Pseudemcibacter aquimaris]WDU58744.1 formimidoylglutamate deiminase [Pseudemcibacter aquimaris]